MAVYVAVFAVVVVGLLVAWRAIGAASTAGHRPLDLGVLAAAIGEGIQLLSAAGTDPAGSAHRARGLAGSVSDRLARADADQLAAAGPPVSLLAAAADDLGWAARMMEGAGYAGNSGLQEAVAALLGHAGACLDEVRPSAPLPV